MRGLYSQVPHLPMAASNMQAGQIETERQRENVRALSTRYTLSMLLSLLSLAPLANLPKQGFPPDPHPPSIPAFCRQTRLGESLCGVRAET
jgi:hypothetical protein